MVSHCELIQAFTCNKFNDSKINSVVEDFTQIFVGAQFLDNCDVFCYNFN